CVLMVALEKRGGAEECFNVLHGMIARNQTNHGSVGGNSQSHSQRRSFVWPGAKALEVDAVRYIDPLPWTIANLIVMPLPSARIDDHRVRTFRQHCKNPGQTSR